MAREVQRSTRLSERAARAGHWVESLRTSDVNRLWAELHRIVSNHPLVRASRSAGLLIEEGATSAYTDSFPDDACAIQQLASSSVQSGRFRIQSQHRSSRYRDSVE